MNVKILSFFSEVSQFRIKIGKITDMPHVFYQKVPKNASKYGEHCAECGRGNFNNYSQSAWHSFFFSTGAMNLGVVFTEGILGEYWA